MNARPNVVLTISRQMGSGGAYVGREVARRAGIKYVDREILQEAATVLEAEDREIEDMEERAASIWTRIATICSVGPPEGPYVPPPIPIKEDEVFKVESNIIRTIAARSDAVIVGRGSFYVLRDHPGLIRAFLHAPESWRVRRVMESYDVKTENDAREMMERSDRQRARFVHSIRGKAWTDSCNYDVCFDTSAIGLEQAIEALTTLVRARLAG
jgi:cytidylate kinase